MHVHPSAKTTPRLRQQLIERVLDEGDSVQEAARAYGLSRTTVYKWLKRWTEEGPSGLLDRSSAPRSIPHRTSSSMAERIAQLRQGRLLMRTIATRVRKAVSTVAAVLKRAGLSRLPPLVPRPPVVRYERERPGELLHVDTKKLGRFKDVGHRIHGDYARRTRHVGWEFAHVCVDDHTRLAYAEVLPDERKETAADFLDRAVAWYRGLGITPERVLSDHGSAYSSRLWRDTCSRLGLEPKHTRPYTPRTNGKAERFIQTMLRSWAYPKPFTTSAYRRQALPHWLRHYNDRRPHSSLGGLPPIQRLRQA